MAIDSAPQDGLSPRELVAVVIKMLEAHGVTVHQASNATVGPQLAAASLLRALGAKPRRPDPANP